MISGSVDVYAGYMPIDRDRATNPSNFWGSFCSSIFACARERDDMAHFWRKGASDWCHICGTVQETNVEIDYPTNAMHQFMGHGDDGAECDEGRFLRICVDCGETVVKTARDEIKQAVRNNPALTSEDAGDIHFDFGVNLN